MAGAFSHRVTADLNYPIAFFQLKGIDSHCAAELGLRRRKVRR
jgi:hypothetical protein